MGRRSDGHTSKSGGNEQGPRRDGGALTQVTHRLLNRPAWPGAQLSAPGPRPDRSGPPQATPFVFIGFNALIAPVDELKHTSPEDVPLTGMSDPDPPVIVAVNFSAVPVHFEVVNALRVGALMVVVARSST